MPNFAQWVPTGRGVTENTIANAVWAGLGMIVSALFTGLAAPQTSREAVLWFLGCLMSLSATFAMAAFGWRKVYPATAVPRAESIKLAGGKPVTPAEKLEVIANRHFRGERVVIDGKRFEHCKFQDTTFEWHGDQWMFNHYEIRGGRGLVSSDFKIQNTIQLLAMMGVLSEEWAKSGRFVIEKKKD